MHKKNIVSGMDARITCHMNHINCKTEKFFVYIPNEIFFNTIEPILSGFLHLYCINCILQAISLPYQSSLFQLQDNFTGMLLHECTSISCHQEGESITYQLHFKLLWQAFSCLNMPQQ